MALSVFDEVAPQFIYGVMHSGDFPGPVDLGSALTNVVRIDALWSLNSDSVSNVLTLLIGSVEIASVLLPARAGYDGTPPVDVLAALGGLSGWTGLVLPSGTQLAIGLASAPSGGEAVRVWGTGGLLATTVGL